MLAGDWCKLYTYNKIIKNYNTFQYQWNNASRVYKAQKYCNEIFEKTLISLTTVLNHYLNQDKDQAYYRILIGNWLIHFIHQCYDKYTTFYKLSSKSEIFTYVLNEKNYTYPSDFLEYSSLSETDFYHLQFYSQLARIMKLNFKEKDFERKIKNLNKINFKRGIKKTIIKSKFNFYKIFSRPKAVIVGPYFKENKFLLEFLVWLKSKRKIIFDDFNHSNFKIKSHEPDQAFRNSQLVFSRKFEEFIVGLCLKNIPICYLENHKKILKDVNKSYKNYNNLTFFTYNDLYHNTRYQFFLASNKKNIKIKSAQHGCGYGMDRLHAGEEYERSIVDTFYTFGWSDSDQTVPLPMPNLIKKVDNNLKSEKILFVTTTRQRYLNRFNLSPNSSTMIKDHIDYPILFLKHLNKINKVYIRHHLIHDLRKWYNKEIISESINGINLDQNPSFYKSLSSSRIFVSDHFGTTFLESMQSNTPSVIFINKKTYLFRKDFSPYIEKLIENKILFYSPIEASKHINFVYSNVEKWWNSTELQKIRQEFVNKHALTHIRWIKKWCEKIID